MVKRDVNSVSLIQDAMAGEGAGAVKGVLGVLWIEKNKYVCF